MLTILTALLGNIHLHFSVRNRSIQLYKIKVFAIHQMAVAAFKCNFMPGSVARRQHCH